MIVCCLDGNKDIVGDEWVVVIFSVCSFIINKIFYYSGLEMDRDRRKNIRLCNIFIIEKIKVKFKNYEFSLFLFFFLYILKDNDRFSLGSYLLIVFCES